MFETYILDLLDGLELHVYLHVQGPLNFDLRFLVTHIPNPLSMAAGSRPIAQLTHVFIL